MMIRAFCAPCSPCSAGLPGHEVRASTSAEEALETADATGGIDLLITDVVMEPMDGFTLSEQMHALFPGMRTVFVSGSDLSEYPERIGSWKALTKPVDLDVITAIVAQEAARPCGERRGQRRSRSQFRVPFQPFNPTATPRVAAARPVAASAPKAAARWLNPTGCAARSSRSGLQDRLPAPAAARGRLPHRAQWPCSATDRPGFGSESSLSRRSTPRRNTGAGKAGRIPSPTASRVSRSRASASRSLRTARTGTGVGPQLRLNRKRERFPPAPVNIPPPSLEAESGVEMQPGQADSGTGIDWPDDRRLSHPQPTRGRALGKRLRCSPDCHQPSGGPQRFDPERARDEAYKQRFIADARAKAHVQHPSILLYMRPAPRTAGSSIPTSTWTARIWRKCMLRDEPSMKWAR